MSAKSYSKVTILPYVEEGKFNMNLEKYKMSIFEGTAHDIEMAAVEEGDTLRYLTGLNPFAPEVTILPDEEKSAKEEYIKDIVIKAEKVLSGIVIKRDDPDWWNKVKRLRPDNINFWSSTDMRLELTNEPTPLHISKSITDLLKYVAIKSGGFPEVARTLSEAKSKAKPPQFYLDELEETISLETEVSKLRNNAGSKLHSMYESNIPKLIYVLKVLDADSAQYRKSTPVDILYQNADRLINAPEKATQDAKRKAAKAFLEIADLNMETLKLRALVKDATYYKFLALKGDGMIYDMESGSALGKTSTHVVEYLKNPLNEEILKKLLGRVENYWKE